MAVLIVVSGVLVLVALIFLIVGLLGEGLTMIWLSIGTSVVAGVFLLLGALQRRGTATPVTESGPSTDMLERVTAVSVRPREAEATSELPAAEEAAPAAAAAGGQVSVVPGRPRYHVDSCRFLAGRPDVETMDVEDARSEGYTACGVCKPDAALEAAASAPEPEPEPERAEEPEAVEEEAPAPAKKAPAKRTRTAAASGAATATVDAPAKPAKKTAAKAAAKAAPAKAASSQVVVIPDRGKYHNEGCRFVKDVPGTVTLAKTSAKRQGYVACGVCKPG